MKLLESTQLVATISAQTKKACQSLVEQGVEPHLAVVLIGSNPDSLTYIDKKQSRGKELGVTVSVYHIEEDEPHNVAIDAVKHLASDEDVHGIIVQLPLPSGWSEQELIDLLSQIPPEKDVDGMRGLWVPSLGQTANPAALIVGSRELLPPMVAAVVLLLGHHGISLEGQKIVLVGKGQLVGAPLLAFFEGIGCEVTAVDESTDSILDICKQADILISGTGQNDLITYQWIKEGAVVIDCSRDVHRDSVDQVASAVSPSKGGVGPVTVQWLLHNTVLAASKQVEGA